tara:strand:- start:1053 stop:2294 length:1242 start_codon:yes stop_codon:yes gene_type:complete
MLAIFLNSFFYYFFNFSVLLIFLIFKYLDTSILKFFLKNKKKIFLILFSFIIFSLPFLIQLYFGEDDYSKRIGVIDINFDQKLYLLKYYFINLLRFESIFLILITVIIHLYLNRKFYNYRQQVFNLNIFFYFLIISVISPPIFFIISPKIVSIYHFLDILLFIIIFYLMLSLSFIIFQKFDFKEKFKDKGFIRLIFIFLIFILNIYFAKIKTIENKLEINEIIKVQKFLKNNNLTNSNIKLFSNDKDIMFLWLLNENTQLSISWGFVNSLKNKEIEYILINNLKGFGVLESEFKSMISLGESKMRESWHMLLFCYMYVANSLHTFSDIDNFTDNLKDKIKKTSPFRAQSQVVPEDEKKRLVKFFNKIDLNDELYPEIVVLNRLRNAFNNIEFRNKNYDLVYSTDIYKIYMLIK